MNLLDWSQSNTILINQIEHRVWRSGPKDLEGNENRHRTFLFFLNNPREIRYLKVDHSFRGDLMYSQLSTSIFSNIFVQNHRYFQKITEVEVLN